MWGILLAYFFTISAISELNHFVSLVYGHLDFCFADRHFLPLWSRRCKWPFRHYYLHVLLLCPLHICSFKNFILCIQTSFMCCRYCLLGCLLLIVCVFFFFFSFLTNKFLYFFFVVKSLLSKSFGENKNEKHTVIANISVHITLTMCHVCWKSYGV